MLNQMAMVAARQGCYKMYWLYTEAWREVHRLWAEIGRRKKERR